MLVDNICVTYGGERMVQHGLNGGRGHRSLFLSAQEDVVGVYMKEGWLPLVGTCVKDVALLVVNRQTGAKRTWSARDEAMCYVSEGLFTKVPGKVLKCFTGRSGWYLDQLSCVWHTPVIKSAMCPQPDTESEPVEGLSTCLSASENRFVRLLVTPSTF